MRTARIRLITPILTGLFLGGLEAEAIASAMFQVTELGAYTFTKDNAGNITAVTSGDGDRTYAFSKTPVTQTLTTSTGFDTATTYTLQNGTHETGFTTGHLTGGGFYTVPTGYYPMGDWIIGGYTEAKSLTLGSNWTLPVLDINSRGEIVGQSAYGSKFGNSAFFSELDGQTHVDPKLGIFGDNNLNNYIASDLRVALTSAVKVDDLGRIIARGTINGVSDSFLLTPAGLSSDPIPAPEPSTFAILAATGVGLGLRSACRRR